MTQLTNIYATYKLLIFDIDGTLADRASGKLLPGRRKFFLALTDNPFDFAGDNHPQIALATNQGGVGYRYWLKTTKPSWFTEKSEAEQAAQLAIYPTQTQAEIRLNDLVEKISRLAQRRLRQYSCFAYKISADIGWAETPPGTEKDHRWSMYWRKPMPGMLLQAMKDASCTAGQTLMIGNHSTDIRAGKAAGCNVAWSGDFFKEVGE